MIFTFKLDGAENAESFDADQYPYTDQVRGSCPSTGQLGGNRRRETGSRKMVSGEWMAGFGFGCG